MRLYCDVIIYFKYGYFYNIEVIPKYAIHSNICFNTNYGEGLKLTMFIRALTIKRDTLCNLGLV